MRLDQMPHFSKPTLAVFPFRDFNIGWRWHLRALKLFPDSNLQWTRYFYDSGDGHARGTAFNDYTEAMNAANDFNQRTSADSTPFGHSAHADPDTCSTIIRTGSRSAATQRWHC